MEGFPPIVRHRCQPVRRPPMRRRVIIVVISIADRKAHARRLATRPRDSRASY